MPLDSQSIRFAQTELAARRRYTGPNDGLLNAAMGNALSGAPGIAASWPLARKVVAFIQQRIGLTGRDVDGLWGDQTQTTYDAHHYRLLHGAPPALWRPEDRAPTNPNNWPRQGSTDADLTAHYGAPGTRLVSLAPPYPHYLSWAPSQEARTIRCHTLVKDSLDRVLRKVLRIYGPDEIIRLRLNQYGGCYNNRPMRGGTRLSTHAWGIALDYDPSNNALNWGRDRATFARAEYEPWWQCWEEEGWVSLGRERNFDWMHVQAARV